ncbi:hypothetical protein R50072_10300 [Simiduia litorea]|uniref:succinylglutamate desuccinylase/aspartoacylase family protein n=1 Tax=Simiduia litorea TaxID=1435348 RepID=UPI0036F41645
MAIHRFRFVAVVCLVVFSLTVWSQTSDDAASKRHYQTGPVAGESSQSVDQPLEAEAPEPVVGEPSHATIQPVNSKAAQVEAEHQAAESPAPYSTDAASPTATNIDLNEVIAPTPGSVIFPEDLAPESSAATASGEQAQAVETALLSTANVGQKPNSVRRLLGVDVPPATTSRLDWTPSKSFAGMAVDTPVLVANGAYDGPTLCLTAAIHGDELNGIEMVRRVLYDIDPKKLHGMVVGVPIVNLLGFSRNSRYLPDRRDLNRYFPGNDRGSVASRLAHAFFTDVIKHCNALVDLHTGSFYRTNITQLRADMSKPAVAEFADLFGDIPVLNTSGNGSSLRAAAVRAGIPAVTLEAGEPMRMQVEVVEEGVKAINTLLEKNGMYPSFSLWAKPSPAFYRSSWVRANSSGILFSAVKLGGKVKKGDVLGQVINPISNEKRDIISAHEGRVLGMALDQFVLPGFAAYHIGILQPRRQKKAVMEAAEVDADDDDEDGMLDRELKPATLEAPKPMTPEEEGFDDE